MQSRKGQVARLSDPQSRLDGFQVAHLADQYYVRVLAQGSAEGLGKTLRISVDFALIDDAVLMVMEKLNRVLDSEDVFVAVFVDLVDYCCQCGRFARACGAGDQDQASGLFAKVLNHLWQTQVVKRF